MTAKEMFEELDYYIYPTNNDKTIIVYKGERNGIQIRRDR